jgi:hypothetical protein
LLAFRIFGDQELLRHGRQWNNGSAVLDYRAGGQMTALRRLHDITTG